MNKYRFPRANTGESVAERVIKKNTGRDEGRNPKEISGTAMIKCFSLLSGLKKTNFLSAKKKVINQRNKQPEEKRK